MPVYSGEFDKTSGAQLESITYWVYKTILHLYDQLEQEKGMDYVSPMCSYSMYMSPMNAVTSHSSMQCLLKTILVCTHCRNMTQ